MKLIIKQYLSSLRERDELDAILPDLLSQMGLNVFSRPRRGTRQSGVDVGATGKIEGDKEKVYLFSIKSGDLTRTSWNGESVQSLRPSLDEILDSYIPSRLPDEHKNKDIVICICLGGDIQEQVRTDVEGYIKKNKRRNLSFEEWNGDKIASLILENFLREDLLPRNARSELRKSLALLDEPESSYQHFKALIESLSQSVNAKASKEIEITVIRQINICLWILFAWSRDIDNFESAYLSSELAVLHAWEIAKPFTSEETKFAKTIQLILLSILGLHQQIAIGYVQKMLPHVAKKHGLSAAVRASSSIDINLKLFDVLGRLALSGIWAYWGLNRETENVDDADNERRLQIFQITSDAVKQLIINNPSLLLPAKDDQAIDISIAVLLLMFDSNNHGDIVAWLSNITERANLALKTQSQYPSTLMGYSDLLEFSDSHDHERLQEVTQGSILFPLIAFWSALLGEKNIYSQIQDIKKDLLAHSNFQLWYPDDTTEERFYTNYDEHGAALSHVCVDRSPRELLKQVFDECENSPYFDKLSSVESGLWPLVLIACRHFRLPLPMHLWRVFREANRGE